jgi:hypothetical protein
MLAAIRDGAGLSAGSTVAVIESAHRSSGPAANAAAADRSAEPDPGQPESDMAGRFR